MKGKRYKVAFSHVLFLMLFINPSINISLNTIINTFLNPFKINTFSLIPYSLTLTILTLTPYPSLPKNQKAPQQIRSYPASATRFWNELYFYGANFIIMEWSLFCIYIYLWSSELFHDSISLKGYSFHIGCFSSPL